MQKILIFGNSGAGKSSLAKALANYYQAQHFDLDVIAWDEERPSVRASLQESTRILTQFFEETDGWVIEGCYSDLLQVAAEQCTEMIFLNPGVDACLQNCRARPWEPHKYPSPEAQDANLPMLLDWVREYEKRQDEFSLQEHQKLFEAHKRRKVEYKSNEAVTRRLSSAAALQG